MGLPNDKLSNVSLLCFPTRQTGLTTNIECKVEGFKVCMKQSYFQETIESFMTLNYDLKSNYNNLSN